MKKVFCFLTFAMIFAAFISFAACGGGGSGSDEQTSTDLTDDQQVSAMNMVLGESSIDDALTSALGGASAMVVDKIKSLPATKETFSVDCIMGGTISINAAGTGEARTYTASFNHCAAFMPNPLGGSDISFSIDGDIVITGTTVTYNDMNVVWVCVSGGGEFHNCHMSGTATGTAPVTYNLAGYCGSTNFTHTGSVTATLVNSHYLINGHATYTITGSSSGQIVRCNYSDFDMTTATCSDYAEACGLTASVSCVPSC